MSGGRGYLTLGFGRPAYRRLAQGMGRSLALHAPDLPRAVVTDVLDEDWSMFDHVIPLREDLSRDLVHKIHLDDYTPFDDTMFLDSDTFATRSLDDVWRQTDRDFGLIGKPAYEGRWWGGDIAVIREICGIEGPLPRFNTGVMRWKRGETAHGVFAAARDLWDRYDELGLGEFRAGLHRADEPILAIAMAWAGLECVPDDGSIMVEPAAMIGRPVLDLHRQRSRIVLPWVDARPAVFHFCGSLRKGGLYRREAAYLRWRSRIGARPAWAATRVVFAPLVALDTQLTWRVLGLVQRTVRRLRGARDETPKNVHV